MLGWIVYWPVLIAFWAVARAAVGWRRHYPLRILPIEAAGLLAVALAGGAATAGANLGSTLGRAMGVDTHGDVWSVTRNNYDFTERLETAIPPGAAVEVFNLYGDVTVQIEDGNRITLIARKTVRASSFAEAERMRRDFTFHIESTRDGARLRSNRDEGIGMPERERYRSSLIIGIPPTASLRIVNRWGDISAPDSLDVEIDNRHGSVVRVGGN